MPVTRIIAIRHGETEWNAQDRFQGQLDSPLTPRGIQQGRGLAARLATRPFADLFASDLGRAKATAELVAHKTGHSIHLDPRLRERDLGIFEGLEAGHVRKTFPEEFRQYKNGGADYVLPKGESVDQSLHRILAAFNDIADAHPDRDVVAITHGAVLSSFLCHVLGVPLGGPRHFKRLNASWNTFLRENGAWHLETWGDLTHLESCGSCDDE